MTAHRRTTVIAIVLALGVAGCGRKEAPKDAEAQTGASPATEQKRADNVVQVSEEMLRDLRITTSTVELHRGGEASSLLGELGVNLNAYAEVSAPLAARVVSLQAVEGQAVRVGEPLATLESGELAKARGDLATAEARRDLAQRALDRKRGLNAEKIVPTREVQEAENETIAAEAQVRAARAALQTLGASDQASDGHEPFDVGASFAGDGSRPRTDARPRPDRRPVQTAVSYWRSLDLVAHGARVRARCRPLDHGRTSADHVRGPS